MGLEKAMLMAKYGEREETFSVLFNPSEYDIVSTNKVSNGSIGDCSNVIQYSSGVDRTLSMKLIFYSEGVNESVKEHTDKLLKMIFPQNKNKKYIEPIITFKWGDFTLSGLIKNLTINYTLFSEDGKPIQADTNLSIVEKGDKGGSSNKGTSNSGSDNPRLGHFKK